MNEQTQQFYEIAAREVATKQTVTGLMAKAFADNNGDEKMTIAAYIRLRVAQLEEQHNFAQQEETRRRAEADRMAAQREAANLSFMGRLGRNAGRFYGKNLAMRKRLDKVTGGDIALSIIIPGWGVLIGIIALMKGETKRGGQMIGISIFSGIVWFFILGGNRA